MSAHTTVGIDGLILQMQIAMATKSTLGILGNPGTGKTQIHKQLGLQWLRKHGAPESNYIYVNAATKTAEFFGMSVPIVQNGTCDFFVAEWFKKLSSNGPAIVFFDELDKLSYRDQTPFLQVLSPERGVDSVKLPDNVHVAFAGNFRTNGNGVQGVSNIVCNRGRLVHFEPEPERVIEYFVGKGLHAWVIAHLVNNPHQINKFDPASDRNCTSRQWEGVSHDLSALFDIVQAPTSKQVVQTVAARLPDAVAQEFAIMTEIQSQLISFKHIMSDPKGAPMPQSQDRGVQWLQVSSVATRCASMKMDEQFEGMSRTKCRVAAFHYIQRFAPEFLQAALPQLLMVAVDDPSYTPGQQSIPLALHKEGNTDLLDKIDANRRLITEE